MICKIKIDAFFALQQKYNGLHTQTLFQVIFSTATPNINYFGKKYRLHDFFQEEIFFPWDSLHYHLILNFHLYLKAFFLSEILTRLHPTLMRNTECFHTWEFHVTWGHKNLWSDLFRHRYWIHILDNFFKMFNRLFWSFTIVIAVSILILSHKNEI